MTRRRRVLLFAVALAASAHRQLPFRGAPTATDDEHLSMTALTSDESSPDARFECWQFMQSFHTYPTVGRSVPLADLSNITYVVLPPKSKEGLHRPPSPMLFVLVSGMAHVSLPSTNDKEGIWISNEENQVIIANDMYGVGHNTEYPLDIETVALQLPFKDGILPAYQVLRSGPC